MNINLILNLFLIVLITYFGLRVFGLIPKRSRGMNNMESKTVDSGKDYETVDTGMYDYNMNNNMSDSYSTHLTRDIEYNASHNDVNNVRGVDRTDIDKMYELSDEVPFANDNGYDNGYDVETESDMYDNVMANDDDMIEGYSTMSYKCCDGAPLDSGTFVNPHNRSKCGRPVDSSNGKISSKDYCNMMCIQDPDQGNREECYSVCMARNGESC